MKLKNGGFPIFRVAGIQVYLHWMWVLVAILEIQFGKQRYESPVWNVVEYLSVFAIVLLHEFGHAFACRSVGGTADTILLWPLGGVAYVSPPPRAGAMLWSIVAGPLVNVVLVPITLLFVHLTRSGAWVLPKDGSDFVLNLAVINGVLLVFNMLPLYPLDGGKIVWALLWFVMGRWRSLMVASVIGLAGGVAFIAGAALLGSMWLVVLAVFGGFSSWKGFQQARAMIKLNAGPKHEEFSCPSCHEHPPAAALWNCACGAVIDTFATNGQCPNCGVAFAVTQCTSCLAKHPIAEWRQYTPGRYSFVASPGVVPPAIPVKRDFQ